MNHLAAPPNFPPAASTKEVSMATIVARAADIVSPVWPLKNFIAVNPLQGLEHLPFEEAVRVADRHRTISSDSDPQRAAVNRELIKWCAAYFDEGQATLPMPGRDRGLYGAFADLARFDARLRRSPAAGELLDSLPESPEAAIEESLDALGIPADEWEEFLRQALAALPGWSGYVKWKELWQNPCDHAKRPATLIEYLAVRCILTRLLWPQARVQAPPDAPPPAWLAELPTKEAEFRAALLCKLLSRDANAAISPPPRSDAQLVFCIDVRSEPFRRAIEAQGAYETLGFAGFFGLPVQVKGYDDEAPHDSCPVLLKPRHLVCDHPAATVDPSRLRRHDQGRALLRTPTTFFQQLKYNFATPFALVEMLGPWFGLRMLARTFAPRLLSWGKQAACSTVMPPVAAEPLLEGISLVEQADYGESALRLMGLTSHFAPLVVFCAHGGHTTNNAYASALDCGACGGNPGGGNARILAGILNSPPVRALLAERGLAIPAGTLFLAAEHETTTDQVELFPPQGVAGPQQARIERLRADLAQAGIVNAQARTLTFGASKVRRSAAVRETQRRSLDWAEVRPEWGLARNAAFIVGPRRLTQSCDLEGRCFLHSYDWKADPEGKFLTTILTAPMVVAQWINSQYLFSTLDNAAYGGGSKVTQNVAGKLGAMQGNASDLMHGLPLQSVFRADGQAYHEPLRLLTVVQAPRTTVDAIVRAQPVLQTLFGNGWVTIVCLDPIDERAYELKRDLTWAVAEESTPLKHEVRRSRTPAKSVNDPAPYHLPAV